jgi:hypothetical protein
VVPLCSQILPRDAILRHTDSRKVLPWLIPSSNAIRWLPSPPYRVALRHVVDQVWVVGPHLLQAERGESTGDTNGELRVSTQRAPWSTLTRVPLQGAPLVGESLHQGRLYVVQGTSQTTQRDPGGTEVITNRARLTLTVFDVTRLPALPLIAQSMIEPPDYFGGALTALWPNDHTLVWRSGGLIPTIIPFFNRRWPMASPPIVGAIPLAGGQVEAAVAPLQAQLVFPWFPWWIPPPPRLFALLIRPQHNRINVPTPTWPPSWETYRTSTSCSRR